MRASANSSRRPVGAQIMGTPIGSGSFWHRLAWHTVVHYSYGRSVHNGRACPQGYGDYHPYLERSEFPAWRWYWGGVLERLDRLMHRWPALRVLWCPRICDRLSGDRGPYRATRRFGVPISWEDYPFPMRPQDHRLLAKVAAQRKRQP
jgi:hypothetical protein